MRATMDFTRLAGVFPGANNLPNGTEQTGFTSVSSNILETFIPGYGPISRFLWTIFGIDISVFVTFGLIAYAISKGGRYFAEWSEDIFQRTFMSTIFIDDFDDLYDMVMVWLAETQGTVSTRSAQAKTQYGSSTDDALDSATNNALDENGMFDYNKWNSRTPPRFEPYYGRRRFWYNGRIFFFRRLKKPTSQKVQIMFYGGGDDDQIELTCIGRTTIPIRELLKEVKVHSLNKLRGSTTIRHPTPKDRARYGGSWSKTTSRPSRPMDTVILDTEQKRTIIADMNEYLHPAAPKWYAARGIPYRRGYLFHGPPGTGKTSLSFALAGIFGLDIFCISLSEPTLTEGDLMMLFNSLPRRCVVLLEDVDAAGLLRDSKSDKKGKASTDDKQKDDKQKKDDTKSDDKKCGSGDAKKDESKTEAKTDEKSEQKDLDIKEVIQDLASALKSLASGSKKKDTDDGDKKGGHPNRAPGTGISLSGLLNAIDGVATQEGRVVILTTNEKDKLDSALIRPGRVDRQIEFKLAMKEQVSQLFVRMYASSDIVPESMLKLDGKIMNGHAKESYVKRLEVNGHANGHTNGHANGHSSSKNQLSLLSETDIDELALEFAEHIPDDTFTPAEIQNHLMRYKKEPRTAIETAPTWVKETLEEKEKQRKAKEAASETAKDD